MIGLVQELEIVWYHARFMTEKYRSEESDKMENCGKQLKTENAKDP